MAKMIEITRTCPMCRKQTIVTVSERGYKAWRNGALIQVALPELNSNQREILVTGTCDDCWNKIFPPEEEEEEEA